MEHGILSTTKTKTEETYGKQMNIQLFIEEVTDKPK